LRLRDIGGLIVIDFIDMESTKNQRAVEDRLRDAVKQDRARIQIGRLSRFGLMEMSRQRLRPSISEAMNITCPRCNGQGTIRGVDSMALAMLRLISEEARKERTAKVIAQLPVDVATYLINEKREWLNQVQNKSTVQIVLVPNRYLETPAYDIRRVRDDEMGANEPTTLSHLIAAQPTVPVDHIGNRDEKPEAPTPLVTAMTPAAPAPINVAPEPKKVEVEHIGIFVRLWRFFFGGVGQKEEPKEKPRTETHREHGRHRNEGRDRGRGHGQRDGHRDGNRDRGRDGQKRDGNRDRPFDRDRQHASKEPRRDQPRDAQSADRPQGDRKPRDHAEPRRDREREPRPAPVAPTAASATPASTPSAPTTATATPESRPDREPREGEARGDGGRGGRSRRGRRRGGRGRNRGDDSRNGGSGDTNAANESANDSGSQSDANQAPTEQRDHSSAPQPQRSFDLPRTESAGESRPEPRQPETKPDVRPAETPTAFQSNQSFHFEPNRSTSEPGKSYTVFSSGPGSSSGRDE
jgi:ribonuclease E